MQQLPLIISLASLLLGCANSKPATHPAQAATLWSQQSAEYEALTTMTFRTATRNLYAAFEDPDWTASVRQQTDSAYRTLPPAVIVDVDETVLDNTPYQARLVREGSAFNPESWNSWVREAQADPVPGALRFTKEAAERGIAVFYLTNRDHVVEEATRTNLRALGFPLADSVDAVLTKGERDGWTSAKQQRRTYLSERYRILMIAGDDLNDFIPAKGISAARRAKLVRDHKAYWGKRWFILPNPMYGSWEQALYGFDDSLKPSQIERAKLQKLETRK